MKSIPEFILPATDALSFKQNDYFNCGICCLLFLIDLVASQVDNSWEDALNSENQLPSSFKLGSTFFNKSVLEHNAQQKKQNQTLRNTFVICTSLSGKN